MGEEKACHQAIASPRTSSNSSGNVPWPSRQLNNWQLRMRRKREEQTIYKLGCFASGNQGGTRNWIIYRPDPFQTGRTSSMRPHAEPSTSLAEIQRAICRTSNDLAQEEQPWRLLEVHAAVQNSIHVEDQYKILVIRDLVIHALKNVGNHQVPILVDQTWRLDQEL